MTAVVKMPDEQIKRDRAKVLYPPQENIMSDDWNSPQNVKQRELEGKISEQKEIIRQLYGVIVRGLVVLKYLIRAGSVGAAYFWLGHKEAYMLAGFIAVTGLVQLVIDKTRQTVNPKIKLSEWDIL
jgi:hypothetical protein